MEALEPNETADMMMALEPETRDWYLSLLATQNMGATNCSVLDSGSSRHLQAEVCVTNSEDLTPLAGFNGSTQWTEGNGYKPAYMQDSITGTNFKVDFEDVDLMTKGLVSNILSLGKLLRKGWSFHLSGSEKEYYANTPGGTHRVQIELSTDAILRMYHDSRTGKERIPLPAQQGSVNSIKQSASEASSKFIHEAFFHRSDDKLTHTLQMTKGYIAAKINSKHCSACAKAKAREFGLSQQRHVMLNTVDDPTFDDDNSLDPYDSEQDEEELEYIAPSIGRELGEQNVPRFDLEKLRPFEAVLVDNKD